MLCTHLGDTSEGNVRGDKLVGRLAQFFDLLLSEAMSPPLGVVLVVLSLPDRGTGDLLGEVLEGTQLVVQRGMLAGGLQAVGEDVEGDIAQVQLVRRCWGGFSEGGSHCMGLYAVRIRSEKQQR